MITAIMLTVQVRKSTQANRIHTAAIQADIQIKYNDIFAEKRMRKCRKLLSEFLLQHRKLPVSDDTVEQWNIVSDLLDYFQGIGTFARAGSLDLEIVHKNIFYWFSYYYPPCVDYIRRHQVKAPLYAADVDWLFIKLSKLDSKVNAGAYLNYSDEEYEKFFQWEIDSMNKYLHIDA